MTKYSVIPVLFILLGLLFDSCSKDFAVSEPAYIYIDQINFSSDSTKGQGSSSSNITDFWVSVDGQQLGANNFPGMFPVILDPNISNNSIRISAGIKDNGITNTRTIYPFYMPATYVQRLVPGKIDTFRPTVYYDTAATIIVIEDFESPNVPIFTNDLDGNPNTSMAHQSDDVFEGNYSGQILLDSANLECTVASSVKVGNIQTTFATSSYLELNYKTNIAFQVGIIAHYGPGDTQTTYIGGVNPSSGGWKKIYFKLTSDIYQANAPHYSVVFRAIKTELVAQTAIYLDNIKFLHY